MIDGQTYYENIEMDTMSISTPTAPSARFSPPSKMLILRELLRGSTHDCPFSRSSCPIDRLESDSKELIHRNGNVVHTVVGLVPLYKHLSI